MIVRMLRRHGWILIALALFAAYGWWRSAPAPVPASAPATLPAIAAPRSDGAKSRNDHAALPANAREVLRRIRSGGPFDDRQDGSVFHNRERRLPPQPRGWYREYTVETPGARDRGARRIVAGGQPPREFWYTDDHYRSFRRIDPATERLP